MLSCYASVGQTAARHHVCAVSKFKQNPERLLNPYHCTQRPNLCCTCQNGHTERWGFLILCSVYKRVTQLPSQYCVSNPLTCERSDASACFPQAAQSAVCCFCSPEQAWPAHHSPPDICHFRSAPHSAANASAVIHDSAVRTLWESSMFANKKRSFDSALISRRLRSMLAVNRSKIRLECSCF